MKKRALFIISSDPRTSPRPAEAVRIAAGVGAWQKVEPILYLHGPAVEMLGEFAEELPDGENYARYLPALLAGPAPIYVQREAPLPDGPLESRGHLVAIQAPELAKLAAESFSVLRF
jgi:hypothetical protein